MQVVLFSFVTIETNDRSIYVNNYYKVIYGHYLFNLESQIENFKEASCTFSKLQKFKNLKN